MVVRFVWFCRITASLVSSEPFARLGLIITLPNHSSAISVQSVGDLPMRRPFGYRAPPLAASAQACGGTGLRWLRPSHAPPPPLDNFRPKFTARDGLCPIVRCIRIDGDERVLQCLAQLPCPDLGRPD